LGSLFNRWSNGAALDRQLRADCRQIPPLKGPEEAGRARHSPAERAQILNQITDRLFGLGVAPGALVRAQDLPPQLHDTSPDTPEDHPRCPAAIKGLRFERYRGYSATRRLRMSTDIDTATSYAESTDRIEKSTLLRAPRSRVWRALTNAEEFGAWFRVALEGNFEVGKSIEGQITYPGYEHLRMVVVVERMEPEELFSYRWHPGGEEPKDPANEPTTLVEFRLEEVEEGTRLTLVESGFDQLPPEKREKAWRENEGGWTIQMDNIRQHVDG
jgi:uncharacterized protein YndB with AHSA1/START domain